MPILRLLLAASLILVGGAVDEAATKEFIPTHEWQLIPPNTAVPPVRM